MAKKGILYVCPTPIGNLEDITFRVLKHLRAVDLIAAEDTRRTLQLLNYFEIKNKLFSYHEHNKDNAGVQLLEYLNSGKDIALVTDAGMPGISDPGEKIIYDCIQEEIEVVVMPGAVAFINALVGSGLSTKKFSFEGFLDRKRKNRQERLELIKNEDRTLIFYESPHRIKKVLKDVLEILGNRQVVIARELTKKYEEFYRGTCKEVINHLNENNPRGEFVLLIEGLEEKEKQESNELLDLTIQEHIIFYIDQGLRKKDAIKKVAKERNLPKREVYSKSFDI